MTDPERFASEWLALREPVDHRSRGEGLVSPLRKWWLGRGASRVLDLGCGTGSNLRYLAPRLPPGQRWTLVDHDPELLALIRKRLGDGPPGVDEIQLHHADLKAFDPVEFAPVDLITASALLDLVSRDWVEGIVESCRHMGAAALFALTWDGTAGFGSGASEMDGVVLDLVRAHQRRDKGLGPALGPEAAPVAASLFEGAGYRTWLLPSPWRLDSTDAGLAALLLSGWSEAAVEQDPSGTRHVEAWADQVGRRVSDASFGLTVGHLDLLALPNTVG